MPLHNQSAKKRRVIRSAATKNLLRINGASVFAAQFKPTSCDVLSVDIMSAIGKDMFMQDSLEILGKRIRQLREKCGLSQEKFAEKCEFDRTYISLLERGKRNPSYTNLLKVAKGFEISISDLLDISNGTKTH
jgi:DNA-binding XRE family transcriptional regulator